MLEKAALYYFSPTGGTKKAGELLAKSIAKEVELCNLIGEVKLTSEDVAVFAVPVFGGRIPAPTVEKILAVKGEGKKAVTTVVYGTRAFEDALVELNDVVEKAGFKVVASCALIAEHSMSAVIGAGRPDEKDAEEITEFGKKILAKLESGEITKLDVPGSRPYEKVFEAPAVPMMLDGCVQCGKCVNVCISDAITIVEGNVETAKEKCCLCLACIKACDVGVRILPPPVAEFIGNKLAPLADVRRENELFV